MPASRPSHFLIELAIRGDESDAYGVLNAVLDTGTLQDAILDMASDRGIRLEVTSAKVLLETPAKSDAATAAPRLKRAR